MMERQRKKANKERCNRGYILEHRDTIKKL